MKTELFVCNTCSTTINVKKFKAHNNLIFSHYYYQCEKCKDYFNKFEMARYE